MQFTRVRIASVVEAILTVSLSAYFVTSAAYKLVHPDKIPEVLAKLPGLQALSGEHARLVGGIVLGLESFVAAALALRFSVGVALWTAILMPLVFAVVVAPHFESLGGDCGCSWRWLPMSPSSGIELIARNVALSIAAAWLLQRTRSAEERAH